MPEIPPYEAPLTEQERRSLLFVLENSPKDDAPKPRNGAKRRDDGEFSEYVLARPELQDTAFYGVLGAMVRAACENSEAVPSTVAVHILARFSATIGRSAYLQIGDQRRHLRMNALIVGPTAKGRKGTSADMPRELFRMAEVRAGGLPVRQLTTLATGEGLIHQLRDPSTYYVGGKEFHDPGAVDKRLFCDEDQRAIGTPFVG